MALLPLNNNTALYFEDTGLPPGRQDLVPLVFIHGFPFSSRQWDPQWDALKGQYRLIRFDQRGHGQTPPGDGQFPLEFLVDDLFSLLDHLNVPKAILCGLSMGGYVALRAVERNPKRVSALILADTRSDADLNQTKIARSETIKNIKKYGVSEFCESFLKTCFAPETFQNNPERIDAIRRIILGNSTLGICGTLMALAGRTDTTSALGSIRVPSLILVGEKDAITPPEISQKLNMVIAGSKLVTIPLAGHLSNIENPDVFTQSLDQFMTRLSSSPTRADGDDE